MLYQLLCLVVRLYWLVTFWLFSFLLFISG